MNRFRGGRNSESLYENMELLTGQRGDGLERAITVRDLAQLGLSKLKRVRHHYQAESAVGPFAPTHPDSSSPGIVEMPHRPQGFEVAGGFGAIHLQWQAPTFHGFAHAEIWRAPSLDRAIPPTLKEAHRVGTTTATVFGDIVTPGSQFHYWIRFINTNEVAGPYQDVDGVLATTSSDVSAIIDEIGEQMRQSELIAHLLAQDADQAQEVAFVDQRTRSQERRLQQVNQHGSRAHQALWQVKSSPWSIQAGIGLLAKPNGTSQVVVAASEFYVFNPQASPDPIQPVFAIDRGQVVIPKVFIERATVEILQAQQITADRVKAGIAVSSPQITGGHFSGGWATFGPGGPHSGHHTAIYADGTIATNRLRLRSSQSNSRLEIKGDRIEVWHGGRLRVRIGRL